MSSFHLSDLISHFWLTSGQVSSSKEKAPPFFPIGILVTTERVIQSHAVVILTDCTTARCCSLINAFWKTWTSKA